MTPDGRPLSYRMCTCATHCANDCEAAHCPPGTPWCDCSCHTEKYKAMAGLVEQKAAEAKVRTIFNDEFVERFFILEMPGPLLHALGKSEEVQQLKREIEEGRFTKEDLKSALDSLFADIKPGYNFDNNEIVCGILVAIAGTPIEGEIITFLAGRRAAEIGRCCRLARRILEDRIQNAGPEQPLPTYHELLYHFCNAFGIEGTPTFWEAVGTISDRYRRMKAILLEKGCYNCGAGTGEVCRPFCNQPRSNAK